jgi:hypothetical protein
MLRRGLLLVLVLLAGAAPAGAWDAHVHRTVTYLALDLLPPEAPDWLRAADARHRLAFQSNQIDRWRGWRALPLSHLNDPDHYLDAELLEQFGLTLETMPRLRREYLKAIIIAKHEHPEGVDPYDASRDPAATKEWPGFLLHAISEQYALLQASFCQVRVLERLNDPARRHQLIQSRELVIYHMGVLAHLVADATQPLHTTKHFNGWAGDNPQGYTTDRRFHAYIDGGVVERHAITYDTLRPLAQAGRAVRADDPWADVHALFERAFELVEPLYRLERDKELDDPAGRDLIIGQLVDATEMLSALWWAAYTSGVPTDEMVESFVKYNSFRPELLPDAPRPEPAQPEER